MYLELFGFKEINKKNQLVLVADGDGRKAEHGAVGQVGRGDDVISEISVNDSPDSLDGEDHQDDEDDHPDYLPGPGRRQSRVAEAADGRVFTEAHQSLEDDPTNSHLACAGIVHSCAIILVSLAILSLNITIA